MRRFGNCSGRAVLRTGILFVLVLVGRPPAAAGRLAEAHAALVNLRRLFEQHSANSLHQKIQQEHTLLDRHAQGLRELQVAAQQRGDLDEWQRIDAEIRRFDATRTLDPPDDLDTASTIHARVARTDAAIDQAELAHAERVIQLGRQLRQLLEERVRQHVREGEIDTAAVYRTELDRLPELPALREAEFIVAEQTALRRPQTDPGEPGPDPVPDPDAALPAEPPEEDPESDTRPQDHHRRSLGGGRPGWFPPDPRRDGLRPSPLAATGKGRLDTNLYIEGYLGTEAQPPLRILIRPRRQNQVFENVAVLVQYYHRGIGRPGQGRERVRLAGLAHVRIERLDTGGVTCDFTPPRSLENHPLYAYMISVFDATGALLQQVGSNQHIKDMGPLRPPPWLQ